MKYRKPTMELTEVVKENVICTSQIEVIPGKDFPGIGEDGEDW